MSAVTPTMGQYETHVFVCTAGDTCPRQGDVQRFVQYLRGELVRAGKRDDIRVNHAGCFSQCGHGPMIVVYPDNVWYAGVQDVGTIGNRMPPSAAHSCHCSV